MDCHNDHALCAQSEGFFNANIKQLADLVAAHRRTPLPHFLLSQKTDDIAAIYDMADRLRADTDYVIVLGMGGSSLCGQLVAQINGWGTIGGGQQNPQLIFADNLDVNSFTHSLAAERLSRSKFLVVSKSGGTLETLAQFTCAFAAIKQAGLDVAQHFVVITQQEESPLYHMAATYDIPTLAHEIDIGGRYSLLTNVGLLPGLIVGIAPEAVRGGAQQAIDSFMNEQTPLQAIAPLAGAALHMAHKKAGRNINLLMVYADRLETFGKWYSQLWAESLGKNGHGSTPVVAIGPRDQHSQLQLYTEGPDDKFYTLISYETKGKGNKATTDFEKESLWDYNYTIGDLVDAEMRATRDTLIGAKRPLRHIHLPKIDGETIGNLTMNFMLETILSADLLGVNAFDQPGVEMGKILAKKYMKQMQ